MIESPTIRPSSLSSVVCPLSSAPLVWYVAAGYGLPAGIEAHVLHYATEMRNHGFDTSVVVFYRLPRDKHRFLAALEQRGIRIVSLTSAAAVRVWLVVAVLFLPWFLYILLFKRRWPVSATFVPWVEGRERLRELSRRLRTEKPDIIHIFGRLPTEAWPLFPPERTIFHEMMTGTVDASWTEQEIRDFRAFAEKAARVFAPGQGVADNLHREFGIERHIDPIFTMCPDEADSPRRHGDTEPASSGDYAGPRTRSRLRPQTTPAKAGGCVNLDPLACRGGRNGDIWFASVSKFTQRL